MTWPWCSQDFDISSTDSMNLCIDIGNSSCKVGIFKYKRIVHLERLPLDNLGDALMRLIDSFEITACMICSTRKMKKSLQRKIASRVECLVLTHKLKLPITIKYKTPSTLGTDRIAAVVGAYMQNPGKDHLIIDAGTCITYDLVDRSGQYLGGNIAPGVEMRIRAMHDYTAKLPLVEMKLNPDYVGNSTTTALQNGAVWGTLFEIEAFIKRVKSTYRRINITLTGGNAEFLAENLKTKIFVSPNLVLTGLNELLLFQKIEF